MTERTKAAARLLRFPPPGTPPDRTLARRKQGALCLHASLRCWTGEEAYSKVVRRHVPVHMRPQAKYLVNVSVTYCVSELQPL